jgi:hypothetical protein
MLKILIGALLLISLSGCNLTPVIEEHFTNRATISHPNMPRPVEYRAIKTKVLVVNGELYVAKTYEDDIESQQFNEDVLRYIGELKSTLCFYRTKLEEPECKALEATKPVVVKKEP